MPQPPRAGARALALAAFSLLLAACGEEGPSYASSIDSTEMIATAGDARTLLSNTVHVVFKEQGFGTPDPSLAKGMPTATAAAATRAIGYVDRIGRLMEPERLQGAALPVAAPGAPQGVLFACQPEETGVDTAGFAIDTDADGIPDNYTADFGGGCSISDEGFVRTLKGKYRIEDTDSGFASYRFTTYHLLSKITYGGTGEYISREVDGVETASFASNAGLHALNIEMVVRINTLSQKENVTLRFKEKSSLTPTGGSLTNGGDLPDATISFGGDYIWLGSSAGGADYRFSITTTEPLRYTKACGTLMDGTILGKLSGNTNAWFAWVWKACNSVSPQYHGFE